jgi:integrase/recombinase XerD
LEEQGVKIPNDISPKHVRAYLTEIASSGKSDNTISIYARCIKTLVRFFHKEKYTYELISFEMPMVEKKKLSFLQPDQLQIVLDACVTNRDKALLLFMIDTGLRRAELTNLNWGDVNLNTGIVIVRRGKGKKARSVAMGAKTRRALLAYGRSFTRGNTEPVFKTRSGKRLAPEGLRSFITRLSNKTGIDFSPHSMRRTFATLAYKAGMNLVDIQGLMGHSSIEMTRDYIQALKDDFIEAHKEHGPIDHFIR